MQTFGPNTESQAFAYAQRRFTLRSRHEFEALASNVDEALRAEVFHPHDFTAEPCVRLFGGNQIFGPDADRQILCGRGVGRGEFASAA